MASKKNAIENNIYNKQLNIEIKSNCYIARYFPIPLKVNIADIKATFQEEKYVVIEAFNDNGEINFIYNELEDEAVYKPNYDIGKLVKVIDFIYTFIDWELYTQDLETYRDVYGIYSEKDFRDFIFNNEFIKLEDLKFLEFSIMNLITYCKNEFSERLLLIFNYEDEFPKIPSKKSDFEVRDEWIPFMSYDYNMITFQTASEFPMQIWFSENQGKSFYDWSWREHEAKRIYITQKHRIEDFKESVKNYNIDKAMEDKK